MAKTKCSYEENAVYELRGGSFVVLDRHRVDGSFEVSRIDDYKNKFIVSELFECTNEIQYGTIREVV